MGHTHRKNRQAALAAEAKATLKKATVKAEARRRPEALKVQSQIGKRGHFQWTTPVRPGQEVRAVCVVCRGCACGCVHGWDRKCGLCLLCVPWVCVWVCAWLGQEVRAVCVLCVLLVCVWVCARLGQKVQALCVPWVCVWVCARLGQEVQAVCVMYAIVCVWVCAVVCVWVWVCAQLGQEVRAVCVFCAVGLRVGVCTDAGVVAVAGY